MSEQIPHVVRRHKQIKKDDATKARNRIKGAFKPGYSLESLELNELVVLFVDVTAELRSRGGSDTLPLPRGLQHRIARSVEE